MPITRLANQPKLTLNHCLLARFGHTSGPAFLAGLASRPAGSTYYAGPAETGGLDGSHGQCLQACLLVSSIKVQIPP